MWKSRYVVLGTDGFGRSDTRRSLRRFFEVDAEHIAVAALHALAEQGTLERSRVNAALEKYALDLKNRTRCTTDTPWKRLKKSWSRTSRKVNPSMSWRSWSVRETGRGGPAAGYPGNRQGLGRVSLAVRGAGEENTGAPR